MLIRFKELSPSYKVRVHARGNPFYEVTAFILQCAANSRVRFRIFRGDHLRASTFVRVWYRAWIPFSVTATVRICIKGVTWDAVCRSSNALHFACSRSAHECKVRASKRRERSASARIRTRSGQDRCEPRGRLVKCTVESHPTAASYSTRCTHTRVCTLI